MKYKFNGQITIFHALIISHYGQTKTPFLYKYIKYFVFTICCALLLKCQCYFWEKFFVSYNLAVFNFATGIRLCFHRTQ